MEAGIDSQNVSFLSACTVRSKEDGEFPDFSEIKRVIDKYERKMKNEEEELKKRKDRIGEEEEASRKKIEEEKRKWDVEKKRVQTTKTFDKVIYLNVGGSRYTTTLSTLTKYPDSMLGAMFSRRHALVQQEDGSYFVDRDGEAFSYILSYLRDSNIVLALVPTFMMELRLRLEYEARFYQLRELEDTLSLMHLQYDYVISRPASRQTRGVFSKSGDITIAPVSHQIIGVANPSVTTGQLIVFDYVKQKQQKVDAVNGLGGSSDINVEINVERANVKVINNSNKMHFHKKVTFYRCNLSQVSFCNCYFEQPVSFEGCLMQGTKFQDVCGLVTHKVHFTPWQVSQAVFDPELLEALKTKGCIY